MRVMVYVKNQEQIRAHDGERVYGTFFAPYDHSLEPYVRIAVGDYISLVEKRGEMNAAYGIDGKQTPGFNYYKRNRIISGFTLFPERRMLND